MDYVRSFLSALKIVGLNVSCMIMEKLQRLCRNMSINTKYKKMWWRLSKCNHAESNKYNKKN